MVSKPPSPVVQPAGTGPDIPDTAPSSAADHGPDPAAATVVSASRAAGPPPVEQSKPSPSDDMGSAPALSDREGAGEHGATPELIEVEGDASSIPEAPAAAAESGPRAATVTGPPTATGARRVVLAAAAALLLALLLGGAGWLYLRSRGGRRATVPAVKVVRVEDSGTEAAPGGDAVRAPSTQPRPSPRPSRRASGRDHKGTGATTPRAKSRPHLPRSGMLNAAVDVSGLAIWPAPAAILYSGKRFRGRSQTFPIGEVPHLGGTVLHDNAASSLKLVGGARLTLFLKPGFVGRSETFSESCSSLKGTKIRNNRASSLKVEPPRTGPLLWRAGPVRGLGMGPRLERHSNAVVVRSEGEAAPAYVVAGAIPATGGSLGKLLHARAGLAKALGRPRSAAVRVARGKLAVQLFTRGVVLYSPASKHGWYRIDGR